MQNQWFFRHPKCTPSACGSLRWDLNLPPTATVATGTSSQHRPRLRWQHLQITNIPVGKTGQVVQLTKLRGSSGCFSKGEPLPNKILNLDHQSWVIESWCEENVWGWKKSFRRSEWYLHRYRCTCDYSSSATSVTGLLASVSQSH